MFEYHKLCFFYYLHLCCLMHPNLINYLDLAEVIKQVKFKCIIKKLFKNKLRSCYLNCYYLKDSIIAIELIIFYGYLSIYPKSFKKGVLPYYLGYCGDSDLIKMKRNFMNVIDFQTMINLLFLSVIFEFNFKFMLNSLKFFFLQFIVCLIIVLF